LERAGEAEVGKLSKETAHPANDQAAEKLVDKTRYHNRLRDNKHRAVNGVEYLVGYAAKKYTGDIGVTV